MTTLASRALSALLAFLPCLPATAQDPPSGRFGVDREPLMITAVHDLPAFVAGCEQGRLGKVFALPEIQEMVRTIEAAHRQHVDALERALARAGNTPMPPFVPFVNALIPLGWRDIHSAKFELLVRDRVEERSQPAFLIAAEPTAAARAATLGRLQVTPERMIGEYWLGKSSRQLALTMSEPPANLDDDLPAQPAGAVFELHVKRLLDLVMESTMRYNAEYAEREMQLLEGFGLTTMKVARWSLASEGDHVRETIDVEFDGRPVGLAAALFDGMAPLPPLPAPKGTMLQLRLSLDVNHLVAAVNAMLESEQMKPLPEDVGDRLRKAWTGGIAFGLAAPAPGGITPRAFLSLGITDQQAFEDLLAEVLPDGRGVQRAITKFGETEVTQLKLDGAPNAFVPSYFFRGGDLYVAESALSVRSLFKAVDKGEPGLDLNQAPALPTRGRQPGFELVFDEAAIYRALVTHWLPLAQMAIPGGTTPDPLIDSADMPHPDDMDELLGVGGGVLLRGSDRLSIAATGTAGGPEVLALLTSYGPLFSAAIEEGLPMIGGEIAEPIVRAWEQKLQQALLAVHERTGGWPEDLAALAGTEEFAGTELLLHPLDTDPADVLDANGETIAKSTFRYYPGSLPVDTEFGEAFDALLIEVTPLSWRRAAYDTTGNTRQMYTWGDNSNIDAIEQKGRKLLEDRKKDGGGNRRP